MEERIRIRIREMAPADWANAFEDALKATTVDKAIRITSPGRVPDTFGALDPSVLIALISGGAQVLAAVVACIATIYAERQKKSKQDTPTQMVTVKVILHGSKDSVEINVHPSRELPVAIIVAALEQIGQIREISI